VKRLIALVLALLLCGGAFAEPGNWYLNIAAEHAQKVGEIANDDGYIGPLHNDFLERVRTTDFGEADGAYCVRFADENGESSMTDLWSHPNYSDAAREKTQTNLLKMLVTQLQGRFVGTDALSVSGLAAWNETYIMPVGFEPCVCVLEYDGLLMAATFMKTGADTITVETVPLLALDNDVSVAELNDRIAEYGIPLVIEKVL